MNAKYRGIVFEDHLLSAGMGMPAIQVQATYRRIKENSITESAPDAEYLRKVFESAMQGNYNRVAINYQTFLWLTNESNAFSEPLSCVDFYFYNRLKDYVILNLDNPNNIDRQKRLNC